MEFRRKFTIYFLPGYPFWKSLPNLQLFYFNTIVPEEWNRLLWQRRFLTIKIQNPWAKTLIVALLLIVSYYLFINYIQICEGTFPDCPCKFRFCKFTTRGNFLLVVKGQLLDLFLKIRTNLKVACELFNSFSETSWLLIYQWQCNFHPFAHLFSSG